MAGKHPRNYCRFQAFIYTLLLAFICLIVPLFTACDTEPAVQTPEDTTPAPADTLPAPGVTPAEPEEPAPAVYPWVSLIAHKATPSNSIRINGYYLEILADMGKPLTMAGADALRNQVTVTDAKGNRYEPVSWGSSGGVRITEYDADGNITLEWEADNTYSFGFVVESKTTDFTLTWSDYEPLYIGNPFESLFLLESG
ncbi:MAG: hypothetical protein MUO19_07560 [Dehalococcoidales bacterium]|nr:hypothetical protein [Dehalococcoidales bacterium]